MRAARAHRGCAHGPGPAVLRALPLGWEEQPARGEEAAAIAEKLLGLGMPEYVLADLADKDLLLCAEAEAVDAHVDEFSLDDGSALRSRA